ncbi:DUF3558 domain-containing protein [Nocardia vulneris]|uniref:DUF3558 domain-containing protein n=1 Tax=Nocardia vulneris TaxID=1141657 RepID=A0ABR4ZGM2_9NOCA|nr:DUF3558 domain-containing protein [Nocardia vulneris]KIA64552.1 hypothetical protein FG87_13450 [Nocardia vulneris]
MPSRGNTVRTLTITLGAVLLLAGCNDTSGTPATSSAPSASASASGTPVQEQAPWDPCLLPVDAVRATGLDPDSKKSALAGVEFDGWKSCAWRAQARWYDLSILAGTPTLSAVQERRDFIDMQPTTVGNRRALQFTMASDRNDHLGCAVAVEVPGGTVIFDMLGRYGAPQEGQPCPLANKHTNDLAKYLPSR